MISEVEGLFGAVFIVITKEDGSSTWIQKDENNPHYQAYLNPQAEHFTPSLPE